MSSGVFTGQRAKEDNVAIQVLECPGECQTLSQGCRHKATITRPLHWWNYPVDTGNLNTTSAPEAFARVGKLSFIECRRGYGKSHHGSPPAVQLSLDLIRFRPGGSKPWIPVSLRALASVAGRGKDVAPLSLRVKVLRFE